MKYLYILQITFTKMYAQRRRYLLLLLTYTVFFLLPLYCLANIRLLSTQAKRMYHATDTLLISWQSKNLPPASILNATEQPLSLSVEEYFAKYQNYINVRATTQPLSHLNIVKGQNFSQTDLDQNLLVCILSSKLANKLQLKPAAYFTWQDQNLRIIGIDDDALTNSIYIPWNLFARHFTRSQHYLHFNTKQLKATDADLVEWQKRFSSLKNDAGAEHIQLSFGAENNAILDSQTSAWQKPRKIAIIISLLLFLLNQLIVLLEKWRKDSSDVAIKLALGATTSSQIWSLSFETLILSSSASVLALLLLMPSVSLVGLAHWFVVDHYVIAIFLVLTTIVCQLLNYLTYRRIKHLEIAQMLKKGGV